MLARGHATSYSARTDGIVLSVTKITFPVKHVKWHAQYDYTHSTVIFSQEMAARKMSATAFGIEMPSKRSQPAQVLLLVQVPLLPV